MRNTIIDAVLAVDSQDALDEDSIDRTRCWSYARGAACRVFDNLTYGRALRALAAGSGQRADHSHCTAVRRRVSIGKRARVSVAVAVPTPIASCHITLSLFGYNSSP